MTASSSESSLVTSRYAAALLDMAQEAGLVEAVERDMSELSAMIQNSDDLRGFIRNPLFDREQQGRTLQALSQSAHLQPLTAKFLGVLTANRRLSGLEGIIKSFHAELSRRRGETVAQVQTAYALTPAQTSALREQLGKTMGSNVTLEVNINKDLLGGMIVTIGSRQIDSSIRNKLDKLKRAMTQGRAA